MDSGYKIAGRNTDLKKTSAYCALLDHDSLESPILKPLTAPILDEVDLDLEPYKLNGAVTDNTSIFRADPSPEVDAAWDNLATEGFELITVSSSDLARAGISATSSVKAPMSWGRGSDAYIAQIDVFHQIHCLNELRKEIHYDYYYKPGYGDRPPPQHMIHKKHCIHILLQNIMCHADVDIVAHNWVHYGNIHQEGRPYAEPLADFSIVKQCRRFDRLLAWAKEEAVDNLSKKWQGLRPPEGAVILDGTGGYF